MFATCLSYSFTVWVLLTDDVQLGTSTLQRTLLGRSKGTRMQTTGTNTATAAAALPPVIFGLPSQSNLYHSYAASTTRRTQLVSRPVSPDSCAVSACPLRNFWRLCVRPTSVAKVGRFRRCHLRLRATSSAQLQMYSCVLAPQDLKDP